MKLAVIGSRQGADLENVAAFVSSLPQGTVVVSGGAEGVDTTAEQSWRRVGGEVISLRAKRFPDYRGEEQYGIERLELNDTEPRMHDLIHDCTWATYNGALFYRDLLIAAECDRLVAFMRRGGSRGAKFTLQVARNEGKPTFVYEAE